MIINKNDFLQDYYQNMSYEDLSLKYKICRSYIFKYLKENNIVKRPRINCKKERYNSTYQLNINYFDDIDREDKAYWIGFLIADGHVNSKGIMLALQRNDIEHIERFLCDIGSNHPIKTDCSGNPCITIPCVHFAKTLLSYGFNHKKSYSLDIEKILSHIPENLIRHCIRGMVDGDGCIKKYMYTYLLKPQYHFGYTGLKNVCDVVENKLEIELRKIKEKGISWTYVTRDPQKICAIYQYLYKDAHVYLKRKKQVFDEINEDLQRL